MKVNKIREVKKDASGNITILHSNGTFHYKENDVALKELFFGIGCYQSVLAYLFFNVVWNYQKYL
jgi:hypothetical protein